MRIYRVWLGREIDLLDEPSILSSIMSPYLHSRWRTSNRPDRLWWKDNWYFFNIRPGHFGTSLIFGKSGDNCCNLQNFRILFRFANHKTYLPGTNGPPKDGRRISLNSVMRRLSKLLHEFGLLGEQSERSTRSPMAIGWLIRQLFRYAYSTIRRDSMCSDERPICRYSKSNFRKKMVRISYVLKTAASESLVRRTARFAK